MLLLSVCRVYVFSRIEINVKIRKNPNKITSGQKKLKILKFKKSQRGDIRNRLFQRSKILYNYYAITVTSDRLPVQYIRRRARVLVLLFGDNHLAKCIQAREYAPSDPSSILPLCVVPRFVAFAVRNDAQVAICWHAAL